MLGTIGEDAGKIWKHLDGNKTPQSAQKIRAAIKVSANRFNLALGWLAREDKVAIAGDEKNLTVALKGK